MKKFLITGILAMALTSSASAKPKHFYKDSKFWLGEAAIGLAVALDAHSTCQSFGYGFVESNFLARGNRSCANQVGYSGAAFGMYSILHWGLWETTHNNRHEAVRLFGQVAVPAVAASIHLPAAIHNYESIERPRRFHREDYY